MKLSIIIPVYNGEKYIKRCIDSVRRLNGFEWECIIINDGSIDDTSKITDAYASKDLRIHVKHIANAGVSNARNVGLSCATGEAVFFLDSDDWLSENAAEELLGGLVNLQNGISTVYSHLSCYADGATEKYKFPDVTGLSFIDTIKELAVRNQKLNSCWGIIYDKNIIKKYSITFNTGMKIAEDTCFVLEYLKHINSLQINSTPIVVYWENEAGAMHSTGLWTIKDDEKCFMQRKLTISELSIPISREDYGLMCNFHFSNTIGYISSACLINNKKHVINALKEYAATEYGRELIECCVVNRFGLTKRLFHTLLSQNKFTCCYYMLKVFELKRRVVN